MEGLLASYERSLFEDFHLTNATAPCSELRPAAYAWDALGKRSVVHTVLFSLQRTSSAADEKPSHTYPIIP